MRLLAILVFLGLAACGADGEPERPEKKADAAIGFDVQGTVEIGVAG
jgi:predicted small lipoprotein YifL